MLGHAGGDDDVYHVGGLAQSGELALQERGIGVGDVVGTQAVDRLGKVKVAMEQDVSVVVGEQHGYIAVFLDYAEQEIDIGTRGGGCRVIGGTYYLAGGIGPYLHTGTLLLREVTHKVARHIQECQHKRHRHDKEAYRAPASCVIDIGHARVGNGVTYS